jgi:hypothetical protein
MIIAINYDEVVNECIAVGHEPSCGYINQYYPQAEGVFCTTLWWVETSASGQRGGVWKHNTLKNEWAKKPQYTQYYDLVVFQLQKSGIPKFWGITLTNLAPEEIARIRDFTSLTKHQQETIDRYLETGVVRGTLGLPTLATTPPETSAIQPTSTGVAKRPVGRPRKTEGSPKTAPKTTVVFAPQQDVALEDKIAALVKEAKALKAAQQEFNQNQLAFLLDVAYHHPDKLPGDLEPFMFRNPDYPPLRLVMQACEPRHKIRLLTQEWSPEMTWITKEQVEQANQLAEQHYQESLALQKQRNEEWRLAETQRRLA